MATVEQAEHMEQMVAASLTRSSARMSAQVGVHGLRATLRALQTAASRLGRTPERRGQVTLQVFTRVAGERDVLGLDDKEITREVRRELSRHGVMFSVEKGQGGQSWVHIQAKDTEVAAHALERAEETLDRRIARREVRSELAEKIRVKVEEMKLERHEKRNRQREQKREHGRPVPRVEVLDDEAARQRGR